MNRKPGVQILFLLSFIEQFGYENSFEVSCMLEPTCLSKKHVTLICVRVAPWPEGNLERHFRHKLQVASCQLSPWLAFLGLILKLTGPHSSR